MVKLPGEVHTVGVELLGDSEYQMEVGTIQEIAHSGGYPSFPFCMLTLGTVPVSAGIVCQDFVLTVGVVAPLDMSAECGSAADGQGMQCSLMLFERVMRCDEVMSVHADDFSEFVSGFHGRP